MIFDGKNGGTVELLETVLVIRRKGIASTLAHGLKGEKRIPYGSITSVQFKEPGMTTGYIQFGVRGGREGRGGVWDATTDENTVLFTKPAADEFQRLRDLVEARISSPASTAGVPTVGVAEELSRLADLRDRGILSDAELDEQKRRLLGSAAPVAPASEVTIPARNAEPARSSLRARAAAVEPPAKKNRLGKVLGFGCLGLLGIIILLSAIGSTVSSDPSLNTASNDIDGNLAAVDTIKPDEIETPTVEAPSNWSYSEDEDKVRGGTTYYATTSSTNSIDQDFPYDSDTTMSMMVRKSPAYGTDVILRISSGQMMCPSYDGCSGTVRFDDGAPQRVNFSGPADNSSDTVFVDGAKAFIGKLKKAKKVTIEKTLYQAGNPQFEFDVAGLEWSH